MPIHRLFFAVTDLETFLSPEFLEKASLTDDAKVDIIIAGQKIVKKGCFHCVRNY